MILLRGDLQPPSAHISQHRVLWPSWALGEVAKELWWGAITFPSFLLE